MSLAVIGAAIGALLSGIITDKLGRKPMIIFSDILLIAGPLILWGSTSIMYLMFGRFIVGVGLGISIMVSSIYLSESAPTQIRGGVVSCYSLMGALGILLSFLTASFITKWSVLLGLGMIPAVI